MSRSSVICVDASLVVRFLVDPDNQTVQALWDQWFQEGYVFVAPSLLHYEVLNALFQYERHGKLSAQATSEALTASLKIPIRLYSEFELHREALQLARRFALPACYDAHYVALAERLGIELWTCDERLFKKVKDNLPWVHSAS